MNDRMTDLYATACLHARDLHPTDVFAWSRCMAEKFSELIVKECSELTLDYKSDEYYHGWLDYRDEIKQHFGVKE